MVQTFYVFHFLNHDKKFNQRKKMIKKLLRLVNVDNLKSKWKQMHNQRFVPKTYTFYLDNEDAFILPTANIYNLAVCSLFFKFKCLSLFHELHQCRPKKLQSVIALVLPNSFVSQLICYNFAVTVVNIQLLSNRKRTFIVTTKPEQYKQLINVGF